MKCTLLLIVVFFSIHSIAQIPSFGKIDKSDLLITDCDFDKGAEAMILIDWGNTYYERGTVGISLFKTVFERRTRIKILNEKGIKRADVSIGFYSHNNDEKILKIDANTYNIDPTGKVITTEVKKNSIYTKKINKYYSELIIAFPEVKVGSVIEYKYSLERETMGQLRDWYFQGRIPVRYSQYQLKVPQIFRFSVQPSIVDNIEDKQEVISERISVDNGFVETNSLKSSYIMRNLPGIKNEPYMGSYKDYQQRLEFQLSQIDYGNGNIQDLRVKWSDIVKDLNQRPDFGKQLENDISGADKLISDAKQIENEEWRIKFISTEIKKTILANEDEDIFTAKGINKTFETKSGNSADLNLLLVKLLRQAGIKANPILFSTRNNGLLNTNFPFLSQFNTVLVAANAGNNLLIIDAADKFGYYKIVPEKVSNSQGFVIEGENGIWKNIFSGKHKYKILAALRGNIDANGNIAGDALVNAFDYARHERSEKLMKDNGAFKSAYFNTKNSSYNIEDLVINNSTADSLPLEQKVKFSGVLSGSGNYKYFSVNLFSGLDENLFTAQERISDIDFGFNQEYIIYGNYNIPEDYIFEGLPENLSMIMPDTSIVFSRTMIAEGNLLNVRINIEFRKPYYTADMYTDFAAFYKKMFAQLNEQVVIKKKTSP